MLFFDPPLPVTFSRDIAPGLAMHCNGCHGDSGGLGTRSYADLMKGGNLGKVVIAGDPDNSLLIHFLDGRRGEAHRMPLGGRPLLAEEIERFRRWIQEGARDDESSVADRVLTLRRVSIAPGRPIRVYCRVNVQSYLTLTVRNPKGVRLLLTEVAALKSPKEPGDGGQPGELLSWDIRAAGDWPRSVAIELRIQYAAGPLEDAEFY